MNPTREPRLDRPQTDASPSPDDPRVVEAVEEYLAALETGQRPERQAFLARHADIAAAVAECIDGLQFLHAVTPRLQAPACAPEGLGELTPEPLGDFQIVREIGRGGMGIVYEAVQRSLGRRVALKVLPLAAALDPKQLQRFRNEAQAAAQLHHTNIVPVYAVGSERGVHYYAMQFIEGRSLAALIEDARRQKGIEDQGSRTADRTFRGQTTDGRSSVPDPRSSILHPPSSVGREAARLGIQTAEALEHAHQLGVVHRDIKPANLLLDAGGRLWVTDFGLALFRSDVTLTMTGEVLGTLRYMSPEQTVARRGVVDHRTDVYSLGLTLYELLTLRPAFDGQDRHELLHQITEEDPPPPRRLDSTIPVELETIVLKATAKGPADRYASARELADDLQRFLDNRPILARRPTLLERATKWGRRHRSVVVSAVVLLLAAVAGLLTTTLLIANEHAATRAAYQREQQRAHEASEQRQRAEENFRQARKAVDYLIHLGDKELDDQPPVRGVRRRMLEAALGYYQDFVDQPQDPSIRAELEASRARVTRLLEELTALEGSGQLTALRERAVQDDLKLKPAQRQRVAELHGRIAEEWRAAFRAFRTLGEEARRAKTLELAVAEEKAVADVLTPEQAVRFRQILIQLRQRGPYGFSDPEVVDALKLTAKQREKIRHIQQDAYLAPWDGGRPPGGKKGRGKGGVSWRAVQQKVLKTLTAEQRARWQELTGAPVQFEMRPPPGPPGGRFGPPGGRFGGFTGPPGGFDPRRPPR
jgi:serine/threonine protein kinase